MRAWKPYHVANCVDVGRFRLIALVHRQSAAAVRFQSDGFQVKRIRSAGASDAEQRSVGQDLLAADQPYVHPLAPLILERLRPRNLFISRSVTLFCRR